MHLFTTRFLSPFAKDEIVNVDVRLEVVLKQFNEIPWYEYIQKSFDMDITNEGIVINDFWCFVIEYQINNTIFKMLLIPNYASTKSFPEKDIRFSIEYFRPKMIKTSKFNQFFGCPKEKLVKDYNTHIKELRLEDITMILCHFIKLEHKILDTIFIKQGNVIDSFH